MPKPQYNVNLTDTGSKNYYKVVGYNQQPPVQQPKVNPLKNWWNSIVNNARQNAFAPANTWDTVAPFVPKYNTNTVQANTGLWDTVTWTPPNPKPVPQPGYSIFDPFGVNETVRLGKSPTKVSYTSPITKPSQYPNNRNTIQQYSDTDNRNRILSWEEIAQLPDYGRPPQEEVAYQQVVWVRDPEVPVGYGYGGYGGGGGYSYFTSPSSPDYIGYGNSGYASIPSSPNYVGYGNSGYASIPSSPNYVGRANDYVSMPQAPSYRGYGGGRNQSIAPTRARYQGGYGSYGGGYGGYAGGQSQRSAWYGALLQWNI